MPLKKYLIFMTTSTIICWVSWLVVLFYIDPNEGGFVGFLLFYLSLLIALVGTFSLIGFFSRVWFSKERVIFRHLGISTRQSIWFSALIVGVLLLQGTHYLRWWSALLLVIFVTLMEFFFLSRKVVHR